MALNFLPLLLTTIATAAPAAPPNQIHNEYQYSLQHMAVHNVQLGPRPYYLVNDMSPSPLKQQLEACGDMTFLPSRFSIGHRGGGTLLMPEETVESVMAGARMGAGIQECDVTFTSDLQLVCRHSQCDLHSTTNIVATELGAKCSSPFVPAKTRISSDANDTATIVVEEEASAKCCTSDITLAEFKTLCGKMDGTNATALTPIDYISGGTPSYRTELYAKCGTLMTHGEYISLVESLGLDFTPELKTPEVPMPFHSATFPASDGVADHDAVNYTQELFAQQMIDEYKAANISPSRVWPQSFLYADILYWMATEPEFGTQAVFLDETGDTAETYDYAVGNLTRYAADGVGIVAPPLQYLVTLQDDGEGGVGNGKKIVPSSYAIRANELGLRIIAWSLERSGRLGDIEHGGYYYSSIADAISRDGDVFNYLHVLAQDVGVIAVFSDWSATVTYYANCFGLV